MALINKIDNTSSLTYGGSTITSNTASTLLLLPPTLLKTVDKLTANINDTLTYTITITIPTLSDMTNLPFIDTIANGDMSSVFYNGMHVSAETISSVYDERDCG